MPARTGEKSETDPAVRELSELLRLGEAGKVEILPEIRRFFDAHPNIWRKLSDLEYSVNVAVCELAARQNVVLQEAYLRRVLELKAELVDPESAHPLQTLLAGGVANCWLAACEAELTAKENLHRSPAQAEFLDRRRDRAIKRYFYSLKILALIKKLLPSASPREVVQKFRGRNGRPEHRVRTLCPTPLETAV
jgi:hypothetical protein